MADSKNSMDYEICTIKLTTQAIEALDELVEVGLFGDDREAALEGFVYAQLRVLDLEGWCGAGKKIKRLLS